MQALRVVLLTSFQPGYQLVRNWADRHGHEIVLAVTPASADSSRYPGAVSLRDEMATRSAVLVVHNLRSVARSVIAALEPDLVISAALPFRIPEDILDVPKYGAVNLHPSALPAGRGPNPMRMVYEGARTIGATLHRTEKDFDTGAVLSQRERPLPEDFTGADVFEMWDAMLAEVLEEGTARAVAGEPGTVQDDTRASYAGVFTEAERVVDLREPADVVQRKVSALNIRQPQARAVVDGYDVVVHEVRRLAETTGGEPGTVLAEHEDGWTVQTADRPVRLVATRNETAGPE